MNGATERIADARPRRFRRYPEYKNSGIEWLGDIPVHWEVSPLRYTCRSIETGGTPPIHYLDFVEKSRVDWFTPGDFGRDLVLRDSARKLTQEAVFLGKARLFPAGSVFVVGIGTLGKVGLIEKSASANQQVNVMIPRDDCDSYFLAHALSILGDVMTTIANSTTLPIINQQQMGALHVPMPPVFEQRQIAAFLLKETAKIDGLVAGKERLIELLQEKRTALITRAVTRGLDPNAPIKDSGVEWLGKIPAHWTMKRLWHLTPRDRQIMYGIVLPGPNVDMGVPIVKGGDVVATRLKLDVLSKTTFEIESRYVRSRLQGGDLVYAIRGSIGEVEIVPDELEGANLTQDAARVAYTKATDGCWLLYALRSKVVFGQLEARAVGATIKGINIRDLKRALIPVPPKSEQIEIASFIDAEVGKIEKLSSKVHQAISHLREFRTALISAAVTGKIDVREAAS